MKTFEIGKIYRDEDDDGIEIEVISRTAKTITFIFTKASWWGAYIDDNKTFRKGVSEYYQDVESIALDNHHAAPRITAD